MERSVLVTAESSTRTSRSTSTNGQPISQQPAMSDSTELVEVSSILPARDFCALVSGLPGLFLLRQVDKSVLMVFLSVGQFDEKFAEIG